MGLAKNVQCNKCDKNWTHYEGSGFQHEIYYCNKCGKQKYYEIVDSCPDLWEQHYHYMEKWKSENENKEKLILEKQLISIDKKIKRHKLKVVGVCDCGGKYKINGDIVCPNCHSKDVNNNGYCLLWD